MKHGLKKGLSLLLALVMVLSLLSVGVFAIDGDTEDTSNIPTEETEDATVPEETEDVTGNVAKIGEQEYGTLDEAIKEAENGATIELLADAQATETFYKSLTFTGGYTVSMDTYGWRYNGSLVFDNANLNINTDAGSDVANNGEAAKWFTMVLGGSITAKNGANITFTFDSTSGANCAIYAGSGGVTINVEDNSTFSIYSKNTKGVTGQGIQLDSTANTGIYVTNNSKFLIDGTNRGYVNSPTIYVEDSDFTIQNCTSNASNGGKFTAINSTINFLDNAGHGLSATTLDINNSVVICNGNAYYGVTVSSEITMDGTSELTANENGWGFTGGALRLASASTIGTFAAGAKVELKDNYRNALENYGTCTFEDGVELTITGNYEPNNGAGVYNGSNGVLTLPENSVIMNNTAGKTGGGICNKNTVTAPASVQLYNNHAATAGDDIYSKGTITFGEVGSNWYLDGDEDGIGCSHAIDGWYLDGYDDDGTRWEAHSKPYYTEEFTYFDSDGTTTGGGMIEIALKAAHGLIPVNEAEGWSISKSKTATNLVKQDDGKYTSNVTLSLPAAEEELVTDVVFVLDKSTSATVEDDALDMLGDLQKQIENTDAKIKVGVVIFNKEANVELELTELTDDSISDIETAIRTKISSGTNMHAGLLAGKEMLDNDTSVDSSRKYLIFVSDGISYMYNAEPTVTAYYWMNDGSPYFSFDNYAWNFKYGNNNAPSDWANWLTTIGTIIDKDDTVIQIGYGSDAYETLVRYRTKDTDEFNNRNNVPTNLATEAGSLESNTYAMNIDRSLYYTYQVYTAAQEAGYHCYAIAAETGDSATTYQWGPSFMNYLANGEKVSFDDIQNNIYYLLDAGSRVVDVIGYGTDNHDNSYDFDFVNDAGALTLTVGGNELAVTNLTDDIDPEMSYPTNTNETSRYGFGEGSADYAGGYPYVLHYYANGQDGYSDECFVWDINVPVSQFETVQLTYTVRLTNPQTDGGTYGEYDDDGSEKYDSLLTNKEAVLYPVDSNNEQGTPEYFNRPTVSYEVVPGLDLSKELSYVGTKAYTGGKVDSGDELTYTVTVRNAGTAELNTVTVTDTLPNYVHFMDATEGYTNQDGVLTWNINTFTVNEEKTFTVKVRVLSSAEGRTLTNTAEAVCGDLYAKDDAVVKVYADGSYDPVQPVKPTTPDLNTEDHVSYIIGYPEDYRTGEPTDNESLWPVKPEGNITRAEAVTIFFRLLTDEARETYWSQVNDYSDVDAGAWYNNAISTLSNMGIVDGYADGTFRPNSAITRAELTKLAVSFFEYADGSFTYGSEYSDVSGGEWYASFVAAANSLGLIEGYPDGTFLPNNPITRAETCTIVNRTLGREPHEDHLLSERVMNTWPDNLKSAWYYEQIQEATNSHDYSWTKESGETVEEWTTKLEERDWAALERIWSSAYSAPGGEVMD